MEVSYAMSDKRVDTERRNSSWRTVLYGFTRSRRHSHRRVLDDEVVFLDWHHPWLFFLAIGTMLLSAADAFLTLQLIERGMIEVNPVMATLMSKSTVVFTSTKLGATGIGILILVYLAKSRFLNRIRTGAILTVFFSFYSCLVCYELVNLFRIM